MSNVLLSKLHDILEDMKAHNVLEDRREYTVDDLQQCYDLTPAEAVDLHWLVQRPFDPNHVNAYSFLSNIRAKEAAYFAEGCLEALHGDLDGWDNEHDRIVIERFLSDMCLYARRAV